MHKALFCFLTLKKDKCEIKSAPAERKSPSGRLFAFLFCFISFSFACAPADMDGQAAREMLESAVFSPQQAFGKYKTFYMKTERTIDKSYIADNYIRELNRGSYDTNALFENKVIQELFVRGDKLRLSSYVENMGMPLELHIIYDGKTLWCVSNFAHKDRREVSFEQAKAFISFPQSDFFKRIRSEFEQSGKKIEYKYLGMRKYNGYKCHIIEMGLEGESEKKAVFFIDKRTKIAVKTGWTGVFPNNSEVKKINNVKGGKFPSVIEMSYGQYFTAVIKYFVKIDENIGDDVFKESNIVLPVRNMYKDKRFQEEKTERRRARIRVVFDSMQSFDAVLGNMQFENFDEDFGTPFDGEVKAVELPVLEKPFIPANAADYRIHMAADIQAEEERKKKEQREKAVAAAKAKASARAEKSEEEKKTADANDETDKLEYNPADAYKGIEAELEEMRHSDPQEYEKMKLIIEEMKEKEERVKQMTSN